MKKLYEKSELAFAIVWIVIYSVLQSVANPLNNMIGVEYSASVVLCALQAVVLFVFLWRNGLMKRYGLCKSDVPACRFLYYIPLIILSTGNLWRGVAADKYSLAGTACRVLMMVFVGFTEELIFRGLLFKAMEKDNVKSAIIVSSATFGIGHLINSLNGNSANLVSNLCQVAFAVSIGFLFVTIFYRGGSLLPCALTHFAYNALNTFGDESWKTPEKLVVHCLVLIALTVGYTLILTRTLPKMQNPCSDGEDNKQSTARSLGRKV